MSLQKATFHMKPDACFLSQSTACLRAYKTYLFIYLMTTRLKGHNYGISKLLL
jgi:hypothetical protein